MQYSLLAEVWGQDFAENIVNTQYTKKINGGNSSTERAENHKNLEKKGKDAINTIKNGEKDLQKSQDNTINQANVENTISPKKNKMIDHKNIGYCKGGTLIKNDNCILLGLLLLFIVDTFYNL